MVQTYAVQVVTPKEWKRLQSTGVLCEHVDGESLGMADPVRGKGYVLNTQSHRLNKYLLSHEFEHLLEEKGTDECACGMRHKKGSSIGRTLGTALALFAAPFTGGASLIPSVLAAGTGAAAGSAIGGAFGGERALGKQALIGLGTGAGGALGGAAGGALAKGFGAGAIGQGIGTGVGAGLGGSLSQSLGQVATGEPTGPGVLRQAGGSALLGGALGGASAAFGGSGNPTGPTAPVPPTPQPVQFGRSLTSTASQGVRPGLSSPGSVLGGGIRSPFSNGIPGAAPSQVGLGSFKLPTPQAAFPARPIPPPTPPPPQAGGDFLSGATQKLKGFLSSLGTNVAAGAALNAFGGGGQQPLLDYGALSAAGGLLAAGEARPTPQLPDVSSLPSVQRFAATTQPGGAASDIGRLAQTRLSEQLTAPFTGLPSDVSSAISRPYQEQRLQETRNLKAYQPGFNLDEPSYQQAIAPSLRGEADALAVATQNERQRFESLRREDIQTALGVDSQQLNSLFTLAQMDITQIQMQAGIDFQTARDFKQTFGSLAALFAERGLGLNNFRMA